MALGRAVHRILSVGILLGIIALSTFGILQGRAQVGGGGGRIKTVELQVTQFVWRLVSNSTGRVLCEVIIEHDGPPTDAEAFNLCVAQIFGSPTATPFPKAGTATPTPAPTQKPVDINNLAEFGVWKYVETRTFSRTVQITLPDMIVSIDAPSGTSAAAYVILNAYEPATDYKITQIVGTLNGAAFTCDSAPCLVPLTSDSVVEFYARSSFGDSSEKVHADVRVARSESGYLVNLSNVTPFRTYSDSCAAIWGMGRISLPHWAEFPSTPAQLNTNRPYYFLAAKLIQYGLVNAKDCPGNGLLSFDSPNACGIERARTEMTQWQNQFDPIIWSSGRDVGIPPRLVKTLIGRESQFWPGNSRYFIYEYGLGQMNQIGADVALRYDNDLFKRICTGILFDCTIPYASLPAWQQAVVRGALIRSINADCPTCAYGVDLSAAQQSIPVIAQVLRTNCYQAKYLTDLMDTSAGYEDMWKFSMVSYHSGYQCLFDAMNQVKKTGNPMDWGHVSLNLACGGAATYVNNLWDDLQSFDTFLVKPGELPTPSARPTYAPTPTPVPSPTPVLSNASIHVIVFIDLNNNGLPDPNEFVDGVNAQVTFPDGTSVTQKVVRGETTFDMTGKVAGSTLAVSLPSLYRTTLIRLPIQGQVPVIFRLPPPQTPPQLP